MKAYKNAEFLNSPAAREIRILSEFLEPATRFRRQGLRNTIVVFGAARVHSMAVSKKNLRLVQAEAPPRKGLAGKRLEEKPPTAPPSVEAPRYYKCAGQLP